MERQTSIPLAANVLGTMGTALWCVQIVPQIWKNWRLKSTDGVPGVMFFLWAICEVPKGAYAIIQNWNIPMQIQPQSLCFFALIAWGQTLVYHSRWKSWRASLLTFAVGVSFAGVELLLVLTLRGPYLRGMDWLIVVLGVISIVLYGLGLVPLYVEAWKHNGRVVGLSWTFLTTDILGAFLSLVALAVQHTFDVLGGTGYILVVCMEIGIGIVQLIWLWRTRKVRHEAKKVGMDYDEYVCGNEKDEKSSTVEVAKEEPTLGQRSISTESFVSMPEPVAYS